jgi:prepilin-type N-terminal cleavage/methylation domain-containing protein
MMGLGQRDRSGFTLIELLTVVVVIAILAGIATPILRGAIAKADAAKVVSEMTIVRGALFRHLTAGSPFPESGDWGTAPPDLSLYIEDMTFVYKDVEYQFFANPARPEAQFNVRYPEDSPIGAALQTYRNPGDAVGSVTWTSTQTKFTLYNDAPRVEASDPAPEEGKGNVGGTGGDEGKVKGKGKGGGN